QRNFSIMGWLLAQGLLRNRLNTIAEGCREVIAEKAVPLLQGFDGRGLGADLDLITAGGLDINLGRRPLGIWVVGFVGSVRGVIIAQGIIRVVLLSPHQIDDRDPKLGDRIRREVGGVDSLEQTTVEKTGTQVLE